MPHNAVLQKTAILKFYNPSADKRRILNTELRLLRHGSAEADGDAIQRDSATAVPEQSTAMEEVKRYVAP